VVAAAFADGINTTTVATATTAVAPATSALTTGGRFRRVARLWAV
jgi:hypothetical protein